MVNTRVKGNKNQRRCIETLIEKGWQVGKVEQRGKFVKEKDLFGLFDLTCIHKKKVLFVQVTSNRPHTHKLYQHFANQHQCKNILIEQWVWVDRKGWKIFKYRPYKKAIKIKWK